MHDTSTETRGGWGHWLADVPRRYGRVTRPGTYVPQIDGLRFLAIALVVFYHAAFRAERAVVPADQLQEGLYAFIPNGVAGVELFFFISGYIIAYPFLSGAKPTLAAFFRRRLTRLEPPYLLALLLCFLAVTLAGGSVGYAPQFEKSDVSFTQSFLASTVYLHGLLFGAPPRLNPPMWSLEIEIQFYLLAPLIIAGYLKLGQRARRLAVGLALCLLLILVQGTVPRIWPAMHYTVLCNGYAFLLGIVFCDHAVATQPFQRPPERRFDLAFLAGMALFALSAATWYPWVQHPVSGLANLLLRAVSIMLLYVGASRGDLARRFLGLPWLAFLGGACYSIYLVHVPLMQVAGTIAFRLTHPQDFGTAFLVAMLVLVPVSVLGGLVYYLLIERPCMRHDWPRRLWARVSGARRRAEPVS